MVKLKTVGSMEHFEKEFRLRESFELCRNVGKNLFVAEGYLIDDARREGGTRDGSKWDLETLWMERPSKERNIRVNVRSCLGSCLHKALHSNILGQFGGAIHKVNYTQQHCLTFFHISEDWTGPAGADAPLPRTVCGDHFDPEVGTWVMDDPPSPLETSP